MPRPANLGLACRGQISPAQARTTPGRAHNEREAQRRAGREMEKGTTQLPRYALAAMEG